jgi:hypothetical protein
MYKNVSCRNFQNVFTFRVITKEIPYYLKMKLIDRMYDLQLFSLLHEAEESKANEKE